MWTAKGTYRTIFRECTKQRHRSFACVLLTYSSRSIAKDDELSIPILIMNRSKEIWGEDAMEFK